MSHALNSSINVMHIDLHVNEPGQPAQSAKVLGPNPLLSVNFQPLTLSQTSPDFYVSAVQVF